MNNLKIHDTITNGTNDFEVVCFSKDKEQISIEGENGVLCSQSIQSLAFVGYTKKETPFVPEIGKKVWFLNDEGKKYHDIWRDSYYDRARAAFLGVFPDQSSAIKRREEVKEFIKTK